jgi:putative transposase
MKKRVRKSTVDQLGAEVRQMLMPLVSGVITTRQELLAWVHERGLRALDELLCNEAELLAGAKGQHSVDRTCNHWGRTMSTVPFGGRRITLSRPRVRSKEGRELTLPSLEHFRHTDGMPERVVEQIVLGVSTRGYHRSLEPTVVGARASGTSKSAASRHLVARTRAQVKEHLARRLDEFDIVAMMLDGVEVGGHVVVAALGFTADGTKIPLGVWQGSTENATVCTSLLNDLVERGLPLEHRILCVIDGGKGLRKALRDVLGDKAIVQRCQVHKRRNVLEHLPEHRRTHVGRVLREAYKSTNAATARKRLRALASWLERNGEESAAASVREGLEETLTVMKLLLPTTLRRSLATTNAIENMLGTVRRVSRNVKRWRDGAMAKRWTGLGVLAAAQGFHRVKGHRDISVLQRALNELNVDAVEEAA